ncbi:hypothetical protein HDC35_001380 [Sphingopyxis sp. JAI128]|nr:hypothetical protein [Sphingopyxis sp. JAI128]
MSPIQIIGGNARSRFGNAADPAAISAAVPSVGSKA